jgi:hypothetical protein
MRAPNGQRRLLRDARAACERKALFPTIARISVR